MIKHGMILIWMRYLKKLDRTYIVQEKQYYIKITRNPLHDKKSLEKDQIIEELEIIVI